MMAGLFTESKHPRGRDGKFVDVIGRMEGMGGKWNADRKEWEVPHERSAELSSLMHDLGLSGEEASSAEASNASFYAMRPDAVRSVLSYQGGNVYPSVALRNNPTITPFQAEFIGNMDAAMDDAGRIGSPQRVFRGMSAAGKQALGVEDPEDLVGNTIVDRGYASTSYDAQVARGITKVVSGDDQVLFQLDVHPDVRAVYVPRVEGALTQYAEQKELLLERGTRWEVTSARADGERWIVTARVFPPDANSGRLPPVREPTPPPPPPPPPPPAKATSDDPWGSLADDSGWGDLA